MITAKTTTTHNTAPNGWARNANPTLKCTIADIDVVIPHPKHGYPVRARNEHDCNPSCTCVPCPLALGSKTTAMPNSVPPIMTTSNPQHRIPVIMLRKLANREVAASWCNVGFIG